MACREAFIVLGRPGFLSESESSYLPGDDPSPETRCRCSLYAEVTKWQRSVG